MAVACPTCFSSIPSGSRFCTACGYSQVPGQSTPPAVPAPTYAPPTYPAPPQSWPARSAITPVHLFFAVLAIVLALLFGFWMLSSDAEPKRSDTEVVPPPPVAPVPQAVEVPRPVPPLASTPAPLSSAALAENNFSGWFVILGGAAASNPGAIEDASRQALRVSQCLGYMPKTGNSSNYAGMNQGYEIVFLGGYADRGVANRVLNWAKRCRRDAYLRQASFLGAE